MKTSFKTDLYELTQAQAALEAGIGNKEAVFEVFTRRLPKGRKYAVLAGTNRIIEALQTFTFGNEEITYLATITKNDGSKLFTEEFLKWLKDYKFNGEIIGYREGEVFFPYSPIMTIKGTFAETVLLETLILSILNYDSAVASAAARMVTVAKGKPIIEMGSRRANEDAAISAARASYTAGFAGTSNIAAGMKYNIKTFGTSAHAFTLAFVDEIDAFEAQVKSLGKSTTLLVDTYNIEEGIKNAIKVAGKELGAIRIDSGDLKEETIKARELLDNSGCTNTKILLSSDLDEYSIAEIIDGGTPADLFGAGTRVVTGSGHPTMGIVFKLVAIEENGKMHPVAKKSDAKISIGGEKVVQRIFEDNKLIDEVFYIAENSGNSLNSETVQTILWKDGEGLIEDVEVVRKRNIKAMAQLPREAKTITAGAPYITATLEEKNKVVWDSLIAGLKNFMKQAGFEDVVIGISGGLDSAVVAALAVDALGAEHVKGITMPSKYSSPETFEDALALADNLGFTCHIKGIHEIVKSFENVIELTGVAEENIQARIRGALLMGYSNQNGGIVLCPTNKSEAAVGYSTLYGDTVGSYAPIADVYKTEVFELAKFYNCKNSVSGKIIPVEIISRVPSAELRLNQSDQDSLPEYDVLDSILFDLIEAGLSIDEIYEKYGDLGVEIVAKVRGSAWKREQEPVGVQVSSRSLKQFDEGVCNE